MTGEPVAVRSVIYSRRMPRGPERAGGGARPNSDGPCVSVVVPVWNEEIRLAANGERLAQFVSLIAGGGELVLVDDGSDDATLRIAEQLASDFAPCVRVVSASHGGKGAALRAGIAAASGETVAFCDVDLATPLGDLGRLVENAQRASALVIGSRDTETSRLLRHESAARELLGKLYNRMAQSVLVPGIRDTQCGAKAASAEVWQLLLAHTREDGFAWDLEVVAVATRLGVPVVEVGVEWSHQPGSKVHVAADGLRMVRAIPRIRRRLPARSQARSEVLGAFEGTNAEQLVEHDAVHWWFAAKGASVKQALRRHGDATGWLIDCGAGAGGVSAALGWPAEHVIAVEPGGSLAAAAAARGLLALQAEATSLPVSGGSMSVACILDVIEHLDDPVGALLEVRRVLRPDGIVVVNVPAHRWLWSEADEVLGHRRRYTRRLLRDELAAAGLCPLSVSHTFAWLVPPVWWRRKRSSNPELGLDVDSALVTTAARLLALLERQVLRFVSLPFGTSILAVAVVTETEK